MFTGEGTTVGDHEIGSLLDERPVVPHPISAPQFERYAGVDAGLPEVPVQRGLIGVEPELVQKLAKVAQVVAQPVRGHSRILPARPGAVLSGGVGGRTQSRLAQFDEFRLRLRVVEELDVRLVRRAFERVQQLMCLLIRLVAALTAELDGQPARTPRQPVGGRPSEPGPLLHLQQSAVHSLQQPWVVLQDLRYGVAGCRDGGVSENHHAVELGLRYQGQLRVQDGDERALGAHQCPAHVHSWSAPPGWYRRPGTRSAHPFGRRQRLPPPRRRRPWASRRRWEPGDSWRSHLH